MASTRHQPFPLRVSAERDETLSRWLWLVKWFLAIPHFVILAFLWVAFLVTTVFAGFSILLTGRYPAAVFDFNVGVLRWTWRVQHYSYGALGTDRYPPFTLADVPDYPAHLEMPRPERLSRGLVLVKWWLLAFPHYLIVALLIGGIGPVVGDDGALRWLFSGLVGVLVLAAGIVLAFTGRYPAPIYDVAVGMDRWALRVAAYAGLMTDQYPPFRLDTGGADPADEPADEPAPPPVTPPGEPVGAGWGPAPAAAPRASGWTGLRVTGLVAGAVMTLTGTGLLALGGVALWADRTQRTDGLLMTSSRHYDTTAHALISEHIALPDVDLGPVGPDSLLGTVRLELAAGDGSPMFVGVAPTDDVRTYLDGVSHATVSELSGDQAPAVTAGERLPADPAAQDFWLASTMGPKPQTLTWDSADGDWTVVVMEPDGSAGINVTVRAGAEVPPLPWIAGAALNVGGLLVIAGIVLMIVPATRASRRAAGSAPAGREFSPVG